MKKIYISPETVAVKMETANMVAVSGTLDSGQKINSSDDFGARGGGGGWDDED